MRFSGWEIDLDICVDENGNVKYSLKEPNDLSQLIDKLLLCRPLIVPCHLFGEKRILVDLTFPLYTFPVKCVLCLIGHNEELEKEILNKACQKDTEIIEYKFPEIICGKDKDPEMKYKSLNLSSLRLSSSEKSRLEREVLSAMNGVVDMFNRYFSEVSNSPKSKIILCRVPNMFTYMLSNFGGIAMTFAKNGVEDRLYKNPFFLSFYLGGDDYYSIYLRILDWHTRH